MNLHVKSGDNVVVLAGKDKGKTGKILSANPDSGRVVVDGVNIVSKHKKPRSAQETGGINKQPGSIDASNVQVICPVCNKATRVAAKEVDGKKVRACKKCGAGLDSKLKADKKAAKSKEDKAAVKSKEDKAPAKAKEEKAPAKKPSKKTEDTAKADKE